MLRSSTLTPRRLRRLRRAALIVASVALGAATLSACIPLVDPPTSGRTYGQGPIDAIWNAADAHPKCPGLTSAELAAMMMVPTFPETGGPLPSPMTLGRSDTIAVGSLNRNLFAFSDPTAQNPYLGAYFTAGVGLWQFDSAGGWNLTAAGAIDSVSSATQAANTIAYRYCNPPSSVARDDASLRRYSWGPWFGCSTSSSWNCEALYQQLYVGEQLNAAVDSRVSRYGGMEQRTCDVAGLGTGLDCWYVDPGRAQGSTGWRAGTYNPSNPNSYTPLPKPFYVIEANGREYRYWLPIDTGYDIGITAYKPLTANARTSLVWDRTAPLCDRTVGRGECTLDFFRRTTLSSGIADLVVRLNAPRTAQVVACDWNGDGVDTPGIFDRGGWTISDQSDGGGARFFGFGNASGDVGVCGDWNGDGRDSPGVFRSGTWFLANSEGGAAANVFGYGNPSGDLPLVGDWDGNGTDTPGLYRNGAWYLSNAAGSPFADAVFGYGNPTGDRPVVGDWDADGKDDPGIVRAGVWYLSVAGQPTASLVFAYGSPGDTPSVGRWVVGAGVGPAIVR